MACEPIPNHAVTTVFGGARHVRAGFGEDLYIRHVRFEMCHKDSSASILNFTAAPWARAPRYSDAETVKHGLRERRPSLRLFVRDGDNGHVCLWPFHGRAALDIIFIVIGGGGGGTSPFVGFVSPGRLGLLRILGRLASSPGPLIMCGRGAERLRCLGFPLGLTSGLRLKGDRPMLDRRRIGGRSDVSCTDTGRAAHGRLQVVSFARGRIRRRRRGVGRRCVGAIGSGTERTETCGPRRPDSRVSVNLVFGSEVALISP